MVEDNDDPLQHEIRTCDTHKALRQKVQLTYLNLCICYKFGDKIKKDCSCDSQLMLECMKRVGAAIREKMLWISNATKIPLFLDKTG